MPNLPVFPNNAADRIRNIPVFIGEGLQTRRAAIQTGIPLLENIPVEYDGFWPMCAVQVDPTSAIDYAKWLLCKSPFAEAGILSGDPRVLIENDTMSRFSVAFYQVNAGAVPAGSIIQPGQNALMPTVEIQFRCSIADSPGDVRWQGILNAGGTLTYTGGNGFVGLTQEGILATRWEVWGRVTETSNVQTSLRMSVQMSVDRLVGDGLNKYSNAVTPVDIPDPPGP